MSQYDWHRKNKTMIEILNNPKYKKVYISGAITDMPNGNKHEFEKYENKFRAMGIEPVNPHKLEHFTEEFFLELQNKIKKNQITTHEYWKAFMIPDLKAMLDCDLIAVIDGWQKSKGANLEVYICRHLGIPIINANTLTEIF